MNRTLRTTSTTLLGFALSWGAARWAKAEEPASAGEGVELLVPMLAESDDRALQLDILKGINAALEGRRRVKAPAGWAAARDKLNAGNDAEIKAQVRALSAVFGDDTALAELRQAAADRARPADERLRAIQSLVASNDPKLPATLQSLLNDPAVREAALSGLAGQDDPKTPDAIIAAYPTLDLPSKRAAINTLAGRAGYAAALMKAVHESKIPAKDLTAATARQLRDLGDPQVDKFVSEMWGVTRATPAEKAHEMAKFKAMATPEKMKEADASRGRAVFARTCAQCHTLYGEGGKVGPDLTGSNRADIDYFVQNVMDPSAVIAKEFQMTIIRTKDRRLITGIATEGDHAIKMTSETGVVLVPKEEIDRMKLSEMSMMPEGLLNGLSEKEALDLVAYLRTKSQVPLPPGADVTPKPIAKP